MSQERRREMVDREHPVLSTVRQCALLDISRSSLYYRPKGNSSEDLAVMKAIDQQYLATPFYGSRRMRVWLQRQGCRASRKRVQRFFDADHGTCSHLPAAQEQQAGVRAQGVSLSVGRHGHRPTQSGVGGRCHLHLYGQRLPVFSCHHGLA